MLTQEYSNGFWNYELSENQLEEQAIHDMQTTGTTDTLEGAATHGFRTTLVINEAKLSDVEVARL